MAMGDLSRSVNRGGARVGSPTSGSWRGSRTGKIAATVYRQSDAATSAPLSLVPYMTAAATTKSVDGAPGTFTITLKADAGATSQAPDGRDWQSELQDGDWVRLAFDDGRAAWDIMLGLIDSVSLRMASSGGAPTKTWTVSGRDLTKCLVDSQTINLPHIGLTTNLGIGSLLSAVNYLSKFNLRNPGEVVRELFRFFMGMDPRPTRGTFWRVPLNLPAEFTPSPNGAGIPSAASRQAGDLVDVDNYITRGLPGVTAAFGSLMSMPAQGSQVWDTLRSYANAPLNECFIDLRPRGTVLESSPLAFAVPKGGGGAGGVVPALVVRERPFNTVPGGVSHRVTTDDNRPFQRLPTTTLDLLDVASLDLSVGHERFNYFLLDAGGANLTQAVTFALGSQFGGGPVGPQGMFDGVPAIDLDSVQKHGLRRMETTSVYVNGVGDQIDVYRTWTRLLRDWYMLAHTYRAGTITIPFGAAGIRVGERLLLRAQDGLPPMQFYVEGVQVQMRVTAAGVPSCSTTLTVTRGTRDPDEIQDYATSYAKASGSAIAAPGGAASGSAATAQANAASSRTAASEGGADRGASVSPEPPPVTGTGPGGGAVTVPAVVE